MNSSEFDTVISSDDWRAAAAIVGLMKVFKEFDIPYNRNDIFNKKKDGLDNLRFNRADLTEEIYLQYVERTYSDEMFHLKVERLLEQDEFDDETIKQVNENLKANSVMKSKFAKIKFDGKNKEEILELIGKNRYELIKETYRNKKLLYANYCNTKQLFSDTGSVCRLNGYYVDMPKKGKSVSYKFDTSTFVFKDEWYYDYIPLGFSYGFDSFFINDNSTINDLYTTNTKLQESLEKEKNKNESGRVNSGKVFFDNIIKSSKYINLDTEVIIKKSDGKFFETMILRKQSIRILKELEKDYGSLCFSINIKGNYIYVQEQITNAIVNLELLNDLIIMLLKEDISGTGIADNRNNYARTVFKLIKINLKIKDEIYKEGEGGRMNRGIFEAKRTAEKVVKELVRKKNENKLRSYRTKLTSSLIFKDYNKFCEILLNLSDYSGVSMNFAYDLFEDFEKNQELAFSFVNALTVLKVENETGENKENDKGDGEDE